MHSEKRSDELFDLCQQLASCQPSPQATHRLHELLVVTCAEGCRRVGGTFGNLFAQVDFLGKHHAMSTDERRELQTMRRHSNSGKAVDGADWPYDLRALTLLLAAVTGADVPGQLRRLLPHGPRPREKGLSISLGHLRCIVTSWDHRYILASTADGDVLVDYTSTADGRDHAYLARLLRPQMQLNLLDCHVEKRDDDASTAATVVTPAIVIVEPDFLVDISSIAACFTDYGHHPLLYTVNRLRPKPNTQAVLLGNFAGTALDDTIAHRTEHHRQQAHSADTTLATSLRQSFREQALRFCACDDFEPGAFKAAAASQVKNIGEAADLLFSQYDGTQALLEPSFVCERLGLQGRVDLMTADMRLLVEQKAGKNLKIEHHSHDGRGQQLESHYVQLLLYYGVLRYNFGRKDTQVDIRLLYSRYPAAQGLMSVAYYQQLLREALKLRNQIVATELLVARQGFGRIVPLLDSSTIYKEVRKDRMFHQYVEPRLMALTAQLAALTPLERAYYERMMTFVYREQTCQKLGSADARLHHGSGAASDLWLMPVAEKAAAGSIFMDMTVLKLGHTAAGTACDRVTLALSAGATGQENFRRGDMVWLYSYSDQPDVRQAILYKGTLADLAADTITVDLANARQNESLLLRHGVRWAVEHATAETGTAAAIRGMQRFAGADARRKALLLGQRPPEADTTVALSRHYHPNYDDVVVRAMQARDYFLLVGPPGTGKTSMAMRFMVEEARAADGRAQLLLMSYTNRAVDEICAMLTDARQDYLRLGSPAACDPRYRDHLLEHAVGDCQRLDDMARRIDRCPVVVATTSAMLSRQELLRLKHFTMCIVDEASQILEPHIVPLLSSDSIDRFVLIGDHKQLPAVVQQSADDAAVGDECLRRLCIDDCRQSLFQRLLRWEHRQGRTQFVGTLSHQGRMHPDVARFPSQAFYAGERLQPVPLTHQRATALDYDGPALDALDRALQQQRMLFLDRDEWCPQAGTPTADGHTAAHTTPPAASSQSSPQEAHIVADLLRRIRRFCGDRFDAARTVGVIVPYRTQIAAIRQELHRLTDMPELLGVSIDTVERYQGSQRDVIVYSFTVNHLYQLDFLTANTFTDSHGQLVDRKLNVALTRARCQMLMTGSASLLATNPLFRRLIDDYRLAPQPRASSTSTG